VAKREHRLCRIEECEGEEEKRGNHFAMRTKANNKVVRERKGKKGAGKERESQSIHFLLL